MKPTRWLLLFVVLIAVSLRFFQLGINPPALYWDEVSLGYNAYSIAQTGSDEYGNHLPLSIRSFNDYKPPLYVYLTVPLIWLFGLTEWVVRLPSAFFGTISVVMIYCLSLLIYRDTKYQQPFALLSALMLAISPWHLQFSRAAFEANLALSTTLISLTAFYGWVRIRQDRKNKQMLSYSLIIVAAVFAAATMYAYHSARLILPLMYVFIAIFNYKPLRANIYQIGLSLLVGLVLVSPLIYISFRGTLVERFDTVSVFSNPGEFSRERERLTRIQDLRTETSGAFGYFYSHKLAQSMIVLRNYFDHYNLDFLFIRGDGQGRHRTYGMGLIYQTLFPVVIYGLYRLFKSDSSRFKKHLILIWLLAAPVASSLTADTPHAIRSFMMVVPFQWITSLGLVGLYQYLVRLKLIFKISIVGVFIILLGINIFYYLNLYYVVSPIKHSKEWQYGYKELVDYIVQVKNNYTEVIVTTAYDQPYVYFAFYQPIKPLEFQKYADNASANIGNIHFRSIEPSFDFYLPNTLVAVEPAKTPDQAKIANQIFFKDGQVAFNLIETASIK